MAKLTSTTAVPNISFDLSYVYDSFFNEGTWKITQSNSTDANINDKIWYNNNGTFTQTAPSIPSEGVALAGVTLKKIMIQDLNTNTLSLKLGSITLSIGSSIVVDSTQQIYLIRTSADTISFVKRFDARANVQNLVSGNISELKLFKGSSYKLVSINVDSSKQRLQKIILDIKNTSDPSKNLQLEMTVDNDGADFQTVQEEQVFTDFS